MRTAIVTGFETFGKYITNPTKWLALSVDGKVIANHKIHSLIFPLTVLFPQGIDDQGKTIVKKAKDINADVIISFGMASDARGFRVERSATNWSYNEKYLSAQENNHPLDPIRPEKEQIRNDLSLWDFEIMKKLFNEAHIPFVSEISDDPGQYACNALIYRTLHEMQVQNIKVPFLFVHVPCTEEAIELLPDFDRENKVLIKKEDTVKAFENILNSLKKD